MSVPNATTWSEKASQFSGGLPPMLVKAEKVAATVILGVHGRKRSGPGESFWQYRPYGFGDSTQRIDWRRSAVADRVYIRENEWESANTIWLWANLGPRMNFKSALAQESKHDRALLLMLALGSLGIRAHERVGGIGSSRRPGYGTSALQKLAEWAIGEKQDTLPKADAMHSRAAAVVISDFLDEPKDIAKSLALLAERGVRGHVVQIADPAEETLPFDGRVEFYALDQTIKYLSPKTQNLRAAYIEKYQAHRARVKDIARALGWSFMVHRTDESAAKALLSLYAQVSDNAAARGGSR